MSNYGHYLTIRSDANLPTDPLLKIFPAQNLIPNLLQCYLLTGLWPIFKKIPPKKEQSDGHMATPHQETFLIIPDGNIQEDQLALTSVHNQLCLGQYNNSGILSHPDLSQHMLNLELELLPGIRNNPTHSCVINKLSPAANVKRPPTKQTSTSTCRHLLSLTDVATNVQHLPP
ncbi:hypothetical protein DSO57_1036914 [Entomophthora muscae]|uniref:Uncharacterized protein n=1 Tax=Entomophthora muscae TaxID=34485 RepID=A0ACC2UJ53_9FUNG|nr:hypothetical protein DSO57_1036914 [Entomophthora muscae]